MMVQYFIEAGLFQLIFLVVYELLLKKETFFQANRWYLITMPVLGFLLPLVEFESLQGLIPVEAITVMPEVWLNPDTSSPTDTDGTPVNWWLLVYLLGVFISLAIFIGKYLSLRKLFSGKSLPTDSRIKIIQIPESRVACTFLGTILLGEKLQEEEKDHILRHEMVHVRQRHSLDLIWFELLKIVCWFNPLIYLFQRRLSELHEFIADSHAIQSVSKQQYFQQLLNTAFGTKDISFINQFFNHSLIKKRIVMLQKKVKDHCQSQVPATASFIGRYAGLYLLFHGR